MVIDGKFLAAGILDNLRQKVSQLHTKGITPTLSVIQIGDDPASNSYIKQKENAALQIGAHLKRIKLGTITPRGLERIIGELNKDASVHGIIIQRPLPRETGIPDKVVQSVIPEKDIDGFVPGSMFKPPVASAVLKILENIHRHLKEDTALIKWLSTKKITVIGRGETAGKPISDMFQKIGCATSIVHSQTTNSEDILRSSDIIISCVGKSDVVRNNAIKTGCILISVGIWRDKDGKLHGDYNEDQVGDTASFLTPTPGGVGPVNVACLMENLVQAATPQKDGQTNSL